MSEGSLKLLWRKHAKKHGVKTAAMSPTGVRGLPDILAIDMGVSEILRDMHRTRAHWIEAKLAKLGPRTSFVFDAKRDATAHQVLWMLNHADLGVPCWWLILGDKHWALVPASAMRLSREAWEQIKQKYGTAPEQLFEPEVNPLRKKAWPKMLKRLEANKAKALRISKGETRDKQ